MYIVGKFLGIFNGSTVFELRTKQSVLLWRFLPCLRSVHVAPTLNVFLGCSTCADCASRSKFVRIYRCNKNRRVTNLLVHVMVLVHITVLVQITTIVHVTLLLPITVLSRIIVMLFVHVTVLVHVMILVHVRCSCCVVKLKVMRATVGRIGCGSFKQWSSSLMVASLSCVQSNFQWPQLALCHRNELNSWLLHDGFIRKYQFTLHYISPKVVHTGVP